MKWQKHVCEDPVGCHRLSLARQLYNKDVVILRLEQFDDDGKLVKLDRTVITAEKLQEMIRKSEEEAAK